MNHRFIKNRDIVLFSIQTWDSGIGFNLKDMALEMAKYNRVMFVNRATDRVTELRSLGRTKKSIAGQAKNGLEKIQENLWTFTPQTTLESINWIRPTRFYDYFNKINNRRVASEINKAAAVLGFQNFIFINDNDFLRGLYLKEFMPQCATDIFYIRDYLNIHPLWKKQGERLEKVMFERADLVVANSSSLARYAAKWNPKSFDIGQGCELDAFLKEDMSVPQDMLSLQKPVIGYCGVITSLRLDANIFAKIAEEIPECSVVLVGPVKDGFDTALLSRYKNIHLLGAKPPESVAAYMFHFDICINPQVINVLTNGNYPRKTDEYLALGKPVIATETDAMDIFAGQVILCKTGEAYAREIRKLMAKKPMSTEDEKISRRNFALTHSWENSVGRLGDAYAESMTKKNKEPEYAHA